MSTTYEIPTPQSVSDLLCILFGDGLSASQCDSPELNGQHVVSFVSDEDKLVALGICDTEFVAYSGAALSMIPVDVANEMISGNSITDAIAGNFYEVMNICSKLLMSESGAHLRLDQTLSAEQSADAIASLQDASQVTGFGVEIPQYGKGTLSFVVT